VDAISQLSQKFELDLVHLTEDPGRIFVEGALRSAEDFFGAELVDLEPSMEVDTPGGSTLTDKDKVTNKERQIKYGQLTGKPLASEGSLERSVQQINEKMNLRKNSDNLIFARIREELDMISNTKKEDRVIITGLVSNEPTPTAMDERKAWLSRIVSLVLNKLDPELAKHILFINQGKSNGRDIPMAEVRFTSTEWAKKARSLFVAKLKSGENFGKVHMANSVCLATRIRVDILKTIARQFSTPDKETMYVSAYTSRPCLHIKTGDNQRPFAMTFADAIARFGSRIEQDGLGEAYKRLGRAFQGLVEQHFVVLKENSGQTPDLSNQGTQANVRKRPLEDQSVSYERSIRGGSRGRGIARGKDPRQAKTARK
jgi:hypothetical protein